MIDNVLGLLSRALGLSVALVGAEQPTRPEEISMKNKTKNSTTEKPSTLATAELAHVTGGCFGAIASRPPKKEECFTMCQDGRG
jgi:hypothetical protein